MVQRHKVEVLYIIIPNRCYPAAHLDAPTEQFLHPVNTEPHAWLARVGVQEAGRRRGRDQRRRVAGALKCRFSFVLNLPEVVVDAVEGRRR